MLLPLSVSRWEEQVTGRRRLCALLLTAAFLAVTATPVQATPTPVSPHATTRCLVWSTAPSCDEVFVAVEEQPRIAGGIARLQSRLRYPADAYSAGVEGRVFVQFLVTRQGRVVNPRVTRGVHPSLDAEALRVVQTAQFEPGRQNRQTVCVQMSLPITFRLDAPSSIGGVDDASTAVQSTGAAVTTRVEEATGAVSNATGTVAGTAAAVDSTSASVVRGVDDTKTSVEATKQSVGEAATSVKSTFRGLFGRKSVKKAESESDAGTSDRMAFSAGDVLVAKIDNVPLRAQPSATADVIVDVGKADAMIYTGTEEEGFLRVQTNGGQGWINKLFVAAQ